MSPEQMRKKSEAMEEAQRHARYSAVDGERNRPNEYPGTSKAIEAAGKRVNSAMMKEEADIGGKDSSINDNRY